MNLFAMMDPLYWVLITPALIFALYAQAKTMGAFNKYKRVGNSANLSGAEAAATMLRGQGIEVVASAAAAQRLSNAVAIEPTRGMLSDHYDPRAKVLRLSPDVFSGRSLASVGVACHEAGHALQHAQGYAPLALRTAIVPVAAFGSYAAFPLIILGFLMTSPMLIQIGVIAFSLIVLFQLVTLPVEFNASSRAKAALLDLGITRGQGEAVGVARVLNAAALTYVAALISSIATLLYYIMVLQGGRR